MDPVRLSDYRRDEFRNSETPATIQMPRRDPTLTLSTDDAPIGPAALVINPESPSPQRIPLPSHKPLIIGKDPTADVRLDDKHVSRQHCRIHLTEHGIHIEDLGSRNGTRVNGTPIKLTVLTHGATLTLGMTTIRLETGEPRELTSFGSAVGASPAMQKVFAMLERIAPSDMSVTLLGETGTGKDVLARAIHENSKRAGKPFIVFDGGAATPTLIESELFGHQKGAFTGAVADRQGAFELAHTGTLFLDEVGEMPLDLQPRLLRVLEERRVRRVGGEEMRDVDVRIVAATNRDLEVEVEEGRFRQDLFFRLSTAVVHVPPLRDRLDDLPALIEAILADLGGGVRVSDATLKALEAYDWPGNVRELKNVMTSAAAFCEGSVVEPRHLMFFKRQHRAETLDRLPLGGRALEVLERAAIKQTLEQCGGNKTKAARALGIASSTLYEKIKKYEL